MISIHSNSIHYSLIPLLHHVNDYEGLAGERRWLQAGAPPSAHQMCLTPGGLTVQRKKQVCTQVPPSSEVAHEHFLRIRARCPLPLVFMLYEFFT